jgi:DNA helicase II / ATP-dependent DNA helicase PcrA
MTHTPTPEQQAVIDAALASEDNLIISALAGAAKTSTLVMIAQALKNKSILCLAFNKKIALEMAERLPPNCQAMTLNSLGHRAWADATGKRLILDTKKSYNILNNLCTELTGSRKEEAFDLFADTLKAIDSAKTAGYIPSGVYPGAKALMRDEELFAWLDDAPTLLQEELIRKATLKSIELAYSGTIDFNDQILMPTVFPAMFPSFPVVMVDEAQDLSALNHATLRKMAKRRLIAVGDPCQAIYGFRGAHEDSMALLADTFKMKPLGLSISFRCPRKVVAEALWRAPHMRYPEWAIEGEVRTLTEWDADTIPETAAIICRNNSPLFSCAIKLLKNGRYPQIVGNDIGKYLLKVMRKFGKDTLSKADTLKAIEDWSIARKTKSRSPEKVDDQAACLRIFCEQGETLGDGIAYAEHLFNSQGPIMLMTGHKSKGLEFDNVFVLNRDLIRTDEGQEKNLLYVIQTRSKKTLSYIHLDNFLDDADPPSQLNPHGELNQ